MAAKRNVDFIVDGFGSGPIGFPPTAHLALLLLFLFYFPLWMRLTSGRGREFVGEFTWGERVVILWPFSFPRVLHLFSPLALAPT